MIKTIRYSVLLLVLVVVSPVLADDLLDRFSNYQIKLSPRMDLTNSGYLAKYVYADALPNGDTVIAWNNEKAAYLTTVDSKGKNTTSTLSIGNYFISELKTFGTNQIHILAFEMMKNGAQQLSNAVQADLSFFYIRLDLTGNVLVKTHLFGGEGTAVAKYWHAFQDSKDADLQFNGEYYSVYTAASRNSKATGVSQGDYFTLLDKTGQIVPGKVSYFKVSNAWGPFTVPVGKEFVTFTSGDGNPFGLVAINRTIVNTKILWPLNKSPAELKKMGDLNYSVIGAGRVVQAEGLDNGKIMALFATSEDLPLQTKERDNVQHELKTQNLLMMSVDNTLSIQTYKWLTHSAETIESAMFFRTSDGIVLLYSTDKAVSNPKIAVFDAELNQIGPERSKGTIYMNRHSRPIKYPNGNIGWVFSAGYGLDATLNIYSPAKANDNSVLSLSGTWATSYEGDTSKIYTMNLEQNGTKANGTYNYKDGKISGNILKTGGSTWFIGTWTQSNASGWFRFEFKSGSNFVGTWGYGNSGKSEGEWNGTRL